MKGDPSSCNPAAWPLGPYFVPRWGFLVRSEIQPTKLLLWQTPPVVPSTDPTK